MLGVNELTIVQSISQRFTTIQSMQIQEVPTSYIPFAAQFFTTNFHVPYKGKSDSRNLKALLFI